MDREEASVGPLVVVGAGVAEVGRTSRAYSKMKTGKATAATVVMQPL